MTTTTDKIDSFIELLNQLKQELKDQDKEKYNQTLILLQRESKRVSEILKKLGLSTMVSVQSVGVTFDLMDVSLNPVEWQELEFGSQRFEHINMLIQQLHSASGYLDNLGKIESDLTLNKHIDDEVRSRYTEGDYGSAVTKVYKVLKDELYEKTGTEDVSKAIGELKKKWATDLQEKDEVKKDFEAGVAHLLHSLSFFRNVDFHSRNWSVTDGKQALYFINTISMALDLLDQYNKK